MFPTSVSYQGLLTGASHGCLTPFHLDLSHLAFHFLPAVAQGRNVSPDPSTTKTGGESADSSLNRRRGPGPLAAHARSVKITPAATTAARTVSTITSTALALVSADMKNCPPADTKVPAGGHESALTGSYRAASELCGCSHHTVKKAVEDRDAGLPPATWRARRIDDWRDLLETWVFTDKRLDVQRLVDRDPD